MRRPVVLLLVMGLFLAQAPAAFAQVAEPVGQTSVSLLTPATAPVQAGNAAWVMLNWVATDGDAWDFRLTATATNGASVGYPENTVDHSSFMENDRLSNGEVDFTALYVSVPSTMVGAVDLNLSVSYQTADGGQSTTVSINVPIVGFDGTGVELTSDDLGSMDQGTTKWVDFWFTGIAPVVGDVQMTVTDAEGFGVVYPQEGTSSSLYYQSQLAGGESDVIRVRLDATGVEPGRYRIEIRTEFVAGGVMSAIDGSSTVVVTEAINRDAGRIVASNSRNRANPYLLDGAEISAANIYVFLETSSGDIATVAFRMDGRFVKTEYVAPYDLYGTYSNGQAAPLRTRRYRGEHTITAEVRFSDGSTETVSAELTIGNGR